MHENPYYLKVKNKNRLFNAWRKIYENGVTSKSKTTREQVKDFSACALKEIERISYQLYKGKFVFVPSIGIPLIRPGKNPRPIVKSPIPNRIVQRSLLDVLQEEPKIRAYILAPSSFGGIESRGVAMAIDTAYNAMKNGAGWYLRSDIEGFFANLPRKEVLKVISDAIPEMKFNDLLDAAVNTELENLSELGKNSDLFPIHEIGVAQGCCLSPLIGNILLHNFDTSMNKDGVTCLRYIDDFIVLGPSEQSVINAFKKAKSMLKAFGLKAYSPGVDQKACLGKTGKGFEFLGCEIIPGLIRPAKKSRKNLLSKIDELFKSSVELMGNPSFLYKKRKTFVETLNEASSVLRGWGNQYSFCNDRTVIEHLDSEVEKRVLKYCGCYEIAKGMVKSDHPQNYRRLLGVHFLGDSKSNPIIK